MECRVLAQLISAYLEGALEEERARAVAIHLAECAACRELLDGVRTTLALCREMEEVEMPPGLSERLLQIQKGAAMRCEAFEEVVAHYLDGVLTASEYHLFEAHAQMCARCRRTLEDAVAVLEKLQDIDPVPVPAGLVERILSATRVLHGELNRSLLWRARRRWAAERMAWAFALKTILLPRWAAAAILCLATLGFLLWNVGDREGRRFYHQFGSRVARAVVRVGDVESEWERWKAQVTDLLRMFRAGGSQPIERLGAPGRGRSSGTSDDPPVSSAPKKPSP